MYIPELTHLSDLMLLLSISNTLYHPELTFHLCFQHVFFLPLKVGRGVCVCVCVCALVCACISMHVQLLSRVQLFVTPWTVACKALLSLEFSRQES